MSTDAEKPAKCRFGDDGPAVVRVKMERGCVCFPDDREQLLCAHHWYKSEPLGACEVIEEFYLEVRPK